MRSALISRTKRRGATALAPALRLFFLTASDMWHLYCDLTRYWSAIDRGCAPNTCHYIEWDDRRWNGCASSCCRTARVSSLLRTYTFRTRRVFWHRSMADSQRVLRSRRCGPCEPRSTRSRSVLRSAHLLAMAIRAKFALCPLTDRTGQEWSIHESRGRRSGELRPFDLSDLSARSRIGRGKSLARCFDSGYHPRGSHTRTKDAARPGPLADVPGQHRGFR